jgi:hypothetical protein
MSVLLMSCASKPPTGPHGGTQEEPDSGVAGSYHIVDTGQRSYYDDQGVIASPGVGEAFFGQDADYEGAQPSYRDNGDGTVSDLNTGLMWQARPDLDEKLTFAEAVVAADTLRLAGYDDWRLPTIKELYSLIRFTGSSHTLTPYIDTAYFGFRFGDESRGERVIDGQYWSSTEYVGLTMGGDATVFGVNFTDGRIKGYPSDVGPGGMPNTQFVRYVRGNLDYGDNSFVNNGDGTIEDLATGLTWQKTDSGATHDWQGALAYCENLQLAAAGDWRLPNAKELQSIVDYTRAPDALDAARVGPAIDPIFEVTDIESFYWTGTTLLESPPMLGTGAHAVYIAFGQAWGNTFGGWTNVHGAGAQRSDPKSGDPGDWADGFGPQGDEIRIYNYSRCVRGGA